MAKKEEEKRILNCNPSKKTESDWGIVSAEEAGVTAGAIPLAKDLRESWWKIGNQGSTGSCVGWASTDSVLRWHLVKAGRLTKTQLLSIRFTWMASKETDEFVNRPETFIDAAGTSLKAALVIQKKYGSVMESLLPFTGGMAGGNPNTFFANAATRKISSYFSLTVPGTDKLKAFRTWLANNGPILVRLDVDSTWDGVGTDGKLTTYHRESTRGGHAVALVGYTKDHFIVRNSWGEGWADKGFAYASNAYALAAFTEGYGVAL